jgi:hypothetical protein
MAAFDPDKFLADEDAGFDPDAFLADDAPPAVATPPETPGALETFGAKFAQGGTFGLADRIGANLQGQAETARSFKDWILGRAGFGDIAKNSAGVEQQALSENRGVLARGGEAHPVAAAVGNVAGMIGNPVTLAAAPYVAGATGLTKAVQAGAPLLTRMMLGGATAAALGTPAVTAQTFAESDGDLEATTLAGLQAGPQTFAMGAAPLVAGPAMAAEALMGDGTQEERLTGALGGLALTGGGALAAGGNRIAAKGPQLRQTAVDQGIRALGMKGRDVKKAGMRGIGGDRAEGLGGAERVSARALDEGVIRPGMDVRNIAEALLPKLEESGSTIGGLRDSITADMAAGPMSERLRLTPTAVAEQVRARVLPELQRNAAYMDQVPAAEAAIGNIEALGEPPLTFSEWAKQQSELARRAHQSGAIGSPEYTQAGMRQSIARELDGVLGDVAKDLGTDSAGRLAAEEARYRDLRLALDAAESATQRAGVNRGFSLTDNIQFASGAGSVPMRLLLGMGNKYLRQHGPSSAAYYANEASKMASSPAVTGTAAIAGPGMAAGAADDLSPEDREKFYQWILSRTGGSNGP